MRAQAATKSVGGQRPMLTRPRGQTTTGLYVLVGDSAGNRPPERKPRFPHSSEARECC
jgi:hypothetical protein